MVMRTERKKTEGWRHTFLEGFETSLARIVQNGHDDESAGGPLWRLPQSFLSPAYEPACLDLGFLDGTENGRRDNRQRRRRVDKSRSCKSVDSINREASFCAFADLRRSAGSRKADFCELRQANGAECTASSLPESVGKLISCNQPSGASPPSRQSDEPAGRGWIEKAAQASVQAKAMMKGISILERARIGAGAGGIAGLITYSCLHPLDTIKTKLQTRGASQIYSGPLDVVVKTFKKQGVFGFYSGISAVLVGSVFSSGVYFGTCELGKALLTQLPGLPAVVVPPIAGAFGNIASSAILVPKELITQRMQAGAKGRSWKVFLNIIEKEGLKGLYTGYSAALIRNLPASVLSFSSFEYLKSAWLKKTGNNHLDPWESVLSGALAGVISSALTTPLDVVKTRLMTQARAEFQKVSHTSSASSVAAELQAKIAASTYKGITSTLHKIWVEEGWIGLTKGMVPRILYSACFSALGYFAFETARLALVKRHIAKRKQMVLQ